MNDKEYKYLGDFSATPSEHSRSMNCHDCKVSWTGCFDNFQCPKCGEGDIPNFRESMEYLPIFTIERA